MPQVLQDIFAGMHNNLFLTPGKALGFTLSLLFFIAENTFSQKQLPAFFTPEASRYADSLMSRMSPDERNAQLFMIAAWSNKDSAHIKQLEWLISVHGIGGLIFFQG